MRPVRRGPSPQAADFADYTVARPLLVSRLGYYCSYCERRIPSAIEVEHLQAKSIHPALEGRWENLLLSCKNCNATKLKKDTPHSELLLPDRDNTLLPFEYSPDGKVAVRPSLSLELSKFGTATLALVGLEKPGTDRVRQRMEVWAIAEEARSDVDSNPGNLAVRRQAVRNATGHGFFSIWMTVFANDSEMRNRLIDAFPGTRDSGCFDANGDLISPAPNPDGLEHGGKC
ncbi:MAG: HNH endonuclease [Bryobacterales bacterium]|nr:HNH endonuclease [Bryobacterales bacterium]